MRFQAVFSAQTWLNRRSISDKLLCLDMRVSLRLFSLGNVPYNFGWVNSGFSIIYWDLNLALLWPLAFGFILRGFKRVLTLTTLYDCMRSNLHPLSKVFFIELALSMCPVVIYSTLFSSIRFSKYCYRCCEMVRNCSFLFELFRTELTDISVWWHALKQTIVCFRNYPFKRYDLLWALIF